MTAAEQAANRRGIAVGTEVHGNLNRPGTDFTGRVVEIYEVEMSGFQVPAVKIEAADGSMRYTLLGEVTLVRGEDDADEPRTPEEFAAMLGDVDAEFAARIRKVRDDQAAGSINPAADPAWVAARDAAGHMTPAEADIYYSALESQNPVIDRRTAEQLRAS